MTAVAMPWSAFLAAGIGAVVAALGYAFWHAWGEANHLRRRLKSATTSLEQLQLSFARFAPQQVVERTIASGVSTSAEKKLSPSCSPTSSVSPR